MIETPMAAPTTPVGVGLASALTRFGWAIPFLLALAVLLAMLASLCIGAYPMSFWRAARIVVHLAWPCPLPANPPWR